MAFKIHLSTIHFPSTDRKKAGAWPAFNSRARTQGARLLYTASLTRPLSISIR